MGGLGGALPGQRRLRSGREAPSGERAQTARAAVVWAVDPGRPGAAGRGSGCNRRAARAPRIAPRRGLGGAAACPSRVAVRAALRGGGGGRGAAVPVPVPVPAGAGTCGAAAAMASSTVRRVALASGLVLAASLLLPKAFLSRGKPQEPPPAPEGERGERGSGGSVPAAVGGSRAPGSPGTRGPPPGRPVPTFRGRPTGSAHRLAAPCPSPNPPNAAGRRPLGCFESGGSSLWGFRLLSAVLLNGTLGSGIAALTRRALAVWCWVLTASGSFWCFCKYNLKVLMV